MSERFKATSANLIHCAVFVRQQVYLIRINDSLDVCIVAWRTISNYEYVWRTENGNAALCSFDFPSKKVQTQRARIGNLFALSGLNALAAFIL